MIDRRLVLAGLAATVVPLGRAAADQPMAETTLKAGTGTLRLKDQIETTTWAFNGQVPGPLLRTLVGKEVKVTLSNTLAQPTSLCWHGVRIANAMDGVSGLTQQAVMPGETFAYRFTPPDAGLYWYHPHAWPNTAEQIGRGLYGVLIVDEVEPPPVDADLLLVLDDWSLDDKGQIIGDFREGFETQPNGRIGSLLTVNSKLTPDRPAMRPGARVRVRILNACSARIVVLSFVGMRVAVIAIDGQPSELFEPAQATLPIGPGSRFEVMIDLPSDRSDRPSIVLRREGAPDQSLLTFDTAGAAVPLREAVKKLTSNALLPTRIPLEKSIRRDIIIATTTKPSVRAKDSESSPSSQIKATTSGSAPPMLWTLEGRASDGFSGPPIFIAKRGSAVTLTFINRTDVVQQMHLHGHVFRLLHDLDDGWDPYWRESVLLAPGKTKHVAFIADNPGRWAIESLILSRQVTGLAGYFVVNETGR